MESTRSVIDNHLKCFGEGDVEGILSDYETDAVLFTPDGPLKGLEAIKPLFDAMVAEFRKPGARFGLSHVAVDGEHGYIVWTAETADNVYELGTDTFLVRDGKIAVQSFASRVVPKR